jgi:type II secretory pathway pseudopilin PulG
MKIIQKRLSLVEIVVALAIIAILLSLLFPTLQRSREAAKIATCMNKMKQISYSFTLYHGDNNKYYPIYDDGKGNNHSTGFLQAMVSWDDQLGDYDGRNLTEAQKQKDNFRQTDDHYNDKLYICPSNAQQRYPAVLKSYQINWEHFNSSGNPSRNVQGVSGWTNIGDGSGENTGIHRYYKAWSTKYTRVARASEAIILTEFHSFDNILGLPGGIRGGILSKNFSPGSPMIAHQQQIGGLSGFYVHDDRTYKQNFLMADGSVKFIQTALTYGEKSDAFYAGRHLSSAELQASYWDILQ